MSLPTFALIVVSVLAFGSQQLDAPRRLGDVAFRLSEDDISQLERLAGETSWLLLGHRAQFSNDWSVEVYARPSTADGLLRRGVLVWAWTDPSWGKDVRDAGQEPPAPRQWRTDAMKTSWAQVELPGRALDDVRDQRDLNRPFRLVGDFGDAELVRLVEFVRSGPAIAGATGTNVVTRTSPIVHVERKADGLVEVQLPLGEWEQQFVTLRPAGDSWSLVRIDKVIN